MVSIICCSGSPAFLQGGHLVEDALMQHRLLLLDHLPGGHRVEGGINLRFRSALPVKEHPERHGGGRDNNNDRTDPRFFHLASLSLSCAGLHRHAAVEAKLVVRCRDKCGFNFAKMLYAR